MLFPIRCSSIYVTVVHHRLTKKCLCQAHPKATRKIEINGADQTASLRAKIMKKTSDQYEKKFRNVRTWSV